jgi:hypothetical protein
MNWFSILIQFGPLLAQMIQAAATLLPTTGGAGRLKAAVSMVVAAEQALASPEVATELTRAVHVGYAALKSAGVVEAPPDPVPVPTQLVLPAT